MNERDLNDRELDQQIKSLVASAVTATPPAPELPPLDELPANPYNSGRSDRTGWIMAGTGIAAAAALVGVLVWANDDNDRTIVAASTTVEVATTEAVTVPPTAATTVPETTAEMTTPPTTVAPPAPTRPDAPSAVVTAGPDGVWRVTDGVAEQLVTEPMSMVLQLPDGSLIMQRKSGWDVGRDASETTLLGWTPGVGTYELFPEEETDRWLRLYDVAVVDGELTLLYAAEPASMNIESPSPELMARSLDTGEVTVVATDFGGWESGYSRMHLAETGLIVGTAYSGPSHGLASFAIGSAGTIDAALLGVEEWYHDDTSKPRMYTVSRDGSTIAWLHGEQLVRQSLTGTVEYEPIELGEAGGRATDLELTNGYVVLSFGSWGDPSVPPPRIIELDTMTSYDTHGLVGAAIIEPTPPWEVDEDLTAPLVGVDFDTVEEMFAAVEQQIVLLKYGPNEDVFEFRRHTLPDGSQAIVAPNFDDSVPETWYRIVMGDAGFGQVMVVGRIESVAVCRNFTFSTATHLCV